jgi:hypothetical protein
VLIEQKVSGGVKGPDDLLWPLRSGGYLGPPAAVKSWLSGAVDRCQKADPTFPRVTAHRLRNTAASLAISAAANPKVVQRMLGHASAAMTLDVYADLFDSDLESVAKDVATSGQVAPVPGGEIASTSRYFADIVVPSVGFEPTLDGF